MLGDQYAADADGLRGAEQGAEVLRVLEAVKGEDELGGDVAQRGVGELVGLGDHALMMRTRDAVEAETIDALDGDLVLAGEREYVGDVGRNKETMDAATPGAQHLEHGVAAVQAVHGATIRRQDRKR